MKTASPAFPSRAAVLLAAHGSSHPGARAALMRFAGSVAATHPGLPVRLAYTAYPLHGNRPEPPEPASLALALESLYRSGMGRLAILSLHVLAGDEFDRMAHILDAHAARRGAELRLAGPLLRDRADVAAVAGALAACLPPDMEAGQAMVFVGHGTSHRARELYLALAQAASGLDPRLFLGVLEAEGPDDPLHVEALAGVLKNRGVRRVLLAPFMTVSGRHAAKDLAGDAAASWRSRLAARGLACRTDLAGLVERGAFIRLWLDKLVRAVATAETPPAPHT